MLSRKHPELELTVMWYYVNGQFVEESEARLPVTDHSFLYGDGCFEGIGVCAGRIIHLDEHVSRMFRSARMLRIPMPVSVSELGEAIVRTAALNRMDDANSAYLRPVLTRGSGPVGVKFSDKLGSPNLVIIPQVADRRVAYMGPIEVLTACVTSWVRPPASALDPRIKTNNYLTNVMAFLEARDRGHDVAILRDTQGYIAEGYGMNVFCVTDGRLLTPMESSALAGITRRNVLRTARKLGIECVETNLTAYDLSCADEVFLTASLDGIAAVSEVDGQALITAAPGPVTTKVRDAYVQMALATGTQVLKSIAPTTHPSEGPRS